MIIKFDPNIVENIPIFLNEEIEKNKNEKYIMFIFNDIYENISNIDEFFNKYVEMMKMFNLPFAFYPYYIHFNKVFPGSYSIPASKMKFIIHGNRVCDVVNQTSYGMFIINVEKILSINFKFSPEFAKCFYIQELIEECFKNNLYVSTSWFLDVPKSSEMANSNFKSGYTITNDQFKTEKDEFVKKYELRGEPANEFIKKLSEKCQMIKQEQENTVITINNVDNINQEAVK